MMSTTVTRGLPRGSVIRHFLPERRDAIRPASPARQRPRPAGGGGRPWICRRSTARVLPRRRDPGGLARPAASYASTICFISKTTPHAGCGAWQASRWVPPPNAYACDDSHLRDSSQPVGALPAGLSIGSPRQEPANHSFEKTVSRIVAVLRRCGLDADDAMTAASCAASRDDYAFHSIPKASGGMRHIESPNDRVRRIQAALLNLLYRLKIAPSDNAHAYIKGRDIVSMARPHVGRRFLVKLDIKNFFPSITTDMLYLKGSSIITAAAIRARSLGPLQMTSTLCNEVTDVIARWCFIPDNDSRGRRCCRLPTGGLTSPALSNIVAGVRLDPRMRAIASYWHVTDTYGAPDQIRLHPVFYTRYADDLCFSSNFYALPRIIPVVARAIRAAGFDVHPDKIRVGKRCHRQQICGVSVSKFIGTPRNYRRSLRTVLFKSALDVVKGRVSPGLVLLPGGDAARLNLAALRGRVSHAHHVNPYQARHLVRALRILEDIHRRPSHRWSPHTIQWVERYTCSTYE